MRSMFLSFALCAIVLSVLPAESEARGRRQHRQSACGGDCGSVMPHTTSCGTQATIAQPAQPVMQPVINPPMTTTVNPAYHPSVTHNVGCGSNVNYASSGCDNCGGGRRGLLRRR